MSYEDGKKLKIFTGNANPKLAKEIADYLGLELGKAFVGKFNNGEIQIMVRMQDKIGHTHRIDASANSQQYRRICRTVTIFPAASRRRKNISNDRIEISLHYFLVAIV